jgi:hypothetical protein
MVHGTLDHVHGFLLLRDLNALHVVRVQLFVGGHFVQLFCNTVKRHYIMRSAYDV